MNVFRFITIITIAFILNSCICRETHLTNAEKQWCAVYDSGQLIVFKSNKNNLDTFTVVQKSEFHTNNECNCLEVGTTQEHIMRLNLKPKKCHDPYYCELTISIEKKSQHTEGIPYFRIYGLEYSGGIDVKKLRTTQITLSTTNKIYNSAFYFAIGLNAKSFGNNYIQCFYWDKLDGLIRYQGIDGEIFELFKK